MSSYSILVHAHYHILWIYSVCILTLCACVFAVVYNYNGQDSCQALFTYVKTCVKSVCEMCKQCVRVQEMRRVNGEIGLLVLLPPLSLSLSLSVLPTINIIIGLLWVWVIVLLRTCTHCVCTCTLCVHVHTCNMDFCTYNELGCVILGKVFKPNPYNQTFLFSFF